MYVGHLSLDVEYFGAESYQEMAGWFINDVPFPSYVLGDAYKTSKYLNRY